MLKALGLPLLTGLVVGLVFGLLRLPIPAPSVLPGIIGIIGIYGGFRIAEAILKGLGK